MGILTARGINSYVAVLAGGNPIALSNIQNHETICVDPDAVVCWMSPDGACDPAIRTDLSWKNLIGQASGESYYFEWNGGDRVSVIIQPSERKGGIQVGID